MNLAEGELEILKRKLCTYVQNAMHFCFNRFGGLQLRPISKLTSTTSEYIREDEFSLGRSEIVKLDREKNRCNDTEAPINLEDCHREYVESQVVGREHKNKEMGIAIWSHTNPFPFLA